MFMDSKFDAKRDKSVHFEINNHVLFIIGISHNLCSSGHAVSDYIICDVSTS